MSERILGFRARVTDERANGKRDDLAKTTRQVYQAVSRPRNRPEMNCGQVQASRYGLFGLRVFTEADQIG
jgi:hypothetical protein